MAARTTTLELEIDAIVGRGPRRGRGAGVTSDRNRDELPLPLPPPAADAVCDILRKATRDVIKRLIGRRMTQMVPGPHEMRRRRAALL